MKNMDSEVIHIPNPARETELQPANLANQGKTTKETPGSMNSSTDPALYHQLILSLYHRFPSSNFLVFFVDFLAFTSYKLA
jgi:hypothetical protein